MRKRIMVVLLVGGLLAVGAAWQPSVNADLSAARSGEPTTAAKSDDGMETDGWGGWLGDPVFAKRVAGAYLTSFFFVDEEGNEDAAGAAIMTINQDGTFFTWSENCYGDPDMPQARHDSPAIGSWERTGRRQLTTYAFIFSKNGVSGDDQGGDVFLAKQELVADFSDDFNDVDIVLETNLRIPCGDGDGNGADDCYECVLFPPNPDADECVWDLGPFTGTSVGKRINVP